MPNQNSDSKRTLREDFLLIRRAIKILNEIMPHYLFWDILVDVSGTVTPYFALYMSARMVNALADSRDIPYLLFLAGLTVGVSFIVSIINRLLAGKRSIKEAFFWQKHEAYFIRVQNKMQYEHLENPDVVNMRSQIYAAMNATGGGLMAVKWNIQGMSHDILQVILSVTLTASMFSMTAEGDFHGIFRFINSPASTLIILLLIVCNASLSVRTASYFRIKRDKALSGLAQSNTMLWAYFNLWGADMIAFDLNRIVMEESKRYCFRPKWLENIQRINIKSAVLSVILNTALNIAIFLFVAAKAFIGAFGIGNFILYQGTISRFVNSVSGIASAIGGLRVNNAYLVRLYEYLDLPNDMYKGSLAVEKRNDIDYEIEFRDVSFRYPRTETWALRHVSMKFKIGDKLAIVGENGSGKTTFIKLLCRLYDPTEGKILLNGIDITRYRYEEYMSLFSVVFQDYSLFAFSLGENVAANVEYDAAKVRDCLVRAGLGEKLSDLDAEQNSVVQEPDPLKRCIGTEYENVGIDFSGGEKQKIALARALYKNAPFVVLDEPTAALDPIAEAAVYEDFNTLVKEKTAVFISHRLSSCRFCDSIAVFDHGMLIQQGSHETLLADEANKYHKLWQAQAQYYTAPTA